MNFFLALLASFPLFTIEKCVLSPHKFFCKETDMNQFWKEFYANTFEYENSIVDITINIEDSYFNLIEHFPNLPTNENRYKLTSLTVKNSSVEQVNERALEELCYLEKLDLSQNKLKNISFIMFLPKTIRYLYLGENNITYLDNFFRHLLKLVLLDLSKNKIRVIDFNNVFWVSDLNFSNNIVDTLIPATSDFKTTKIDISHNKIQNFNESKLKNKFNNYVDISNNQLYSIELTSGKNILNISGNNNLTKLVAVGGAINIKNLDFSSTSYLLTSIINITVSDRLLISNNKIPIVNNTAITKFIYSPDATIDISNSSITDISSDSFSSTRIYSLNLSRNNIKRLKNYLFPNSTITILNLSYSNIYHIEKYAFENLKSTNIILKGNKLSNVKNIFNKVKVVTIDLSFNPIDIVSRKSFVNCYRITTLNFSNCIIERLENEAFFGLKDLKTIDLSYNKLYILETSTFSNLGIENLILHGSKIDVVQEKVFHNMDNIKELNLSGVGLKSLESCSFHNLSSIEVVDLRNNNIPTIPYHLFSNMAQLRKVYLDGNNITTINPFSNRLPIEFLSFTFSGIFNSNEMFNLNLKYLEIKDSKIHRLMDNSFAGLYNLISLSFDNSYVGFVEGEALSNLFNLKFLDSQTLFKHTKLIRQNMFKDLRSLTLLNMSHLSLEDIEENSFVGLKKLDTLLLNNNNLTQLREYTFFGLTSLKTLYLSCSNIISVNKKTFKGLDKLEYLHLHSNNLLEIGAGIFKDLGKLIELHLENNNISSLNNESFIGLKSLKKLHLQGNNLQNVPVGTFKHLPSLQLLNLSNNLIKLLKTGSLSNLGSLECLDMSENQLDNLNNIDVFFSLKHLEVIKIDGNNLKQFDYTRFLKNLRKLRHVGISHNKWKCDTLSLMIEVINSRNVSYTPDVPSYDDDNIDGIGCLDICKFVYCLSENVDQTVHY